MAHGARCRLQGLYHSRIGGGKEVVGGYARGYYLLASAWWWCGKEVGGGYEEQSKYLLANACDSSGAGHPFHTEKDMV